MVSTDKLIVSIFYFTFLAKAALVYALLYDDFFDDILWFIGLQNVIGAIIFMFLFFKKSSREGSLMYVSIFLIVTRTLCIWFAAVLYERYKDSDTGQWAFLLILLLELVNSAVIGFIVQDLWKLRIPEEEKKLSDF